MKHIENPFESIEEGQTVGMDELSPDCCTLTFVQRTRIVLLPFIYDNLYQTYTEWVEMIVHYCGCLKSSLDEGVKEHIKFVVEGNISKSVYKKIYIEALSFILQNYVVLFFLFIGRLFNVNKYKLN